MNANRLSFDANSGATPRFLYGRAVPVGATACVDSSATCPTIFLQYEVLPVLNNIEICGMHGSDGTKKSAIP